MAFRCQLPSSSPRNFPTVTFLQQISVILAVTNKEIKEKRMKIIPMGDYYVWHCDWCDSTNYTIWTRMDRDGVSCTACHRHVFLLPDESSPVFTPARANMGESGRCYHL